MSMRIQALFYPPSLWAIFWIVLSSQVHAEEKLSPGCFDFSKKLTQPSDEIHALSLPADDSGWSSQSGHREDGVVWAVTRALISGRGLSSLLKEVSEHWTTKSKRIDHMEVVPVADPNYLLRQDIEFKVYPFPLITISWIEQWAFALSKGTVVDPSEVVIYYQKSQGTSHIKHLCGNIVLRKLSSKATDVSIYEEAKATGRSEEDTVNGIVGTIKTFRAGQD